MLYTMSCGGAGGACGGGGFAAGFAIPTAGKLGGVHCMYGDELPKKITQALVCAVICSILGTPLTLICMIPVIRKLKKVCI